jgi:RimJ/RimL family protein N-acetyltransferase
MVMDRDPEVTKYIAGPWQDPKKHRAFIEDTRALSDPVPFGYWAITRTNALDIFLGWVMLLPSKTNLTQAEIGWRLTKATWGQGIATEATQCIIDLLLEHYPHTEIMAEIHPENSGSIKVAEKMNMTLKDKTPINNKDDLIYKLND